MRTLSLKKTPIDIGEHGFVSDTYTTNKLDQLKRKFNIPNYMHGLCGEEITPGRCIYRDNVNKLSVLTPSQRNKEVKHLGISITNNNKGDRITIVESGLMYNDSFNFAASPMSPLWLGYEGNVTDLMPTFGPTKLLGFVVDKRTAFIYHETNNKCGVVLELYERRVRSNIWKVPYNGKLYKAHIYKMREGKYRPSLDHTIDIKDDVMEIRFNEKIKGRVVYSMLS